MLVSNAPSQWLTRCTCLSAVRQHATGTNSALIQDDDDVVHKISGEFQRGWRCASTRACYGMSTGWPQTACRREKVLGNLFSSTRSIQRVPAFELCPPVWNGTCVGGLLALCERQVGGMLVRLPPHSPDTRTEEMITSMKEKPGKFYHLRMPCEVLLQAVLHPNLA